MLKFRFEDDNYVFSTEDAEEARTIWFALVEYRDKLVSSMDTKQYGTASYSYEDDYFQASTVARIAQMLGATKEAAQKELNV